jgi:hypothetical protein
MTMGGEIWVTIDTDPASAAGGVPSRPEAVHGASAAEPLRGEDPAGRGATRLRLPRGAACAQTDAAGSQPEVLLRVPKPVLVGSRSECMSPVDFEVRRTFGQCGVVCAQTTIKHRNR